MDLNRDLPEPFVESLDPLDRDRILDSMAAPRLPAYWNNPLVAGDLQIAGTPVPGLPDVATIGHDQREALTHDPAVIAGAVYPINPSSVVAATALGARPDEEVLDLAAAPGGKTLLMAAAMKNSGRIAAVEPVRGRFHRMRANLARCGVTNVQFYQDDGRRTGRKVPGRFDRVLLDAPCSTEARFRIGEPDTFAHWSPRKVKETSRKQRGLIRSAFMALKPGGVMVYCTCAYSRAENELVVEYLLDAEASAQLTAVTIEGPQWREGSLEQTLRILPDQVFEGFFIAKIVKSG